MCRYRVTLFLSGLLCLCMQLGCAAWYPDLMQSDGEPSTLPLPKLAPDTVVLEIAFVTVPANDPAVGDKLWHELDEQHLAVDTRRRLLRNGLRCGLAGMQLPQPLRDRITTTPMRRDGNALGQGTVIETGAAPTQRRLQARAGRRNEIVLCESTKSLVVLYHNDDNGVSGNSYDAGQGLLAAKAFPLGDGRVELELTPEVQYGQAKQDWVGEAGVFVLNASRQHKVFDQLKIKTTLSPGQTLVMTCSEEPAGLGDAFFSSTKGDGEMQKLVLIRLAQTLYDDQLQSQQKLPPTDSSPDVDIDADK